METIISAIISAGAAIIVCIINSNKQALKLEAQLEQWHTVTDLKIDTLSERVDKHNQIIDRTYKLERDVAVLQEKIYDE